MKETCPECGAKAIHDVPSQNFPYRYCAYCQWHEDLRDEFGEVES